MDYAAIARETGCVETALPDIVHRCEARFQGEAPTPAQVKAWCQGELRAAAPHLFAPAQTLWAKLNMTEEQFHQMPASWRLAQARSQPPTTPHPNRPVYRSLTSAELAELDGLGLTGAARHEWARARQQTPLPQG
jgi:hypothetical protein